MPHGRQLFDVLCPDLWGAFRWVRDHELLTGTADDQAAHLHDDARLRDLTHRLAYAVDSGSDTLTSLLTKDAVFTTGSWQATGADDVAGVLRKRQADWKFTRRRLANLLTRVVDGVGWLTAYNQLDCASQDGRVESHYGRSFGRLERVEGGWRIADWVESTDFVSSYEEEASSIALRAANRPAKQPEPELKAPRLAPITGGRETYEALKDDTWEAHRWFLAQDVLARSVEEELERLKAKVLIRELVSNYAYSDDSMDYAWISANFTDDAVLDNPPMRRVGNAAVVDAFRGWNRGRVNYYGFHRYSNLSIRVVPDSTDAWLIAYFNVPSANGALRATILGRYFARVSKASGRWKIADWRIQLDPRVTLKPADKPSEAWA